MDDGHSIIKPSKHAGSQPQNLIFPTAGTNQQPEALSPEDTGFYLFLSLSKAETQLILQFRLSSGLQTMTAMQLDEKKIKIRNYAYTMT